MSIETLIVWLDETLEDAEAELRREQSRFHQLTTDETSEL
jgi:hypothetical protein